MERIMRTAAANARKGINVGVNPFAPPPAEGAADDSGGRGQRGGGGRRSGDAGSGRQAGGQGGADAQGRGGFGNLSDEDRKKMSDLRQKMQAASPEEREKLQKQMSDLMAKAGITIGQGRGGFGQGRGSEAQGGAPAEAQGDRQGRGDGAGRGGFGGQGRGGPGRRAGADPIRASVRGGAHGAGYTDGDR